MANTAQTGDAQALADRVRAGERRALARAITLVESTRADHRDLARQLLERLGPPDSVARRIGLSGQVRSGGRLHRMGGS